MDLFSIICEYLYLYIFNPLRLAFSEHLLGDFNPLEVQLFVYKGELTTGYLSSEETITDEVGNVIAIQTFTVEDLLVFITTIVIFILLFIVACKFIVWLFKQISFITRF